MKLNNAIYALKARYWKIRGDIRDGRLQAFIRKWQSELLATERAYLLLTRAKIESALGGLRQGQTQTRKHLLLLAWLFPPTVSGGVYRPTALLKYGSNSGWRFSVLAGPGPDRPSSAGQELNAQIPKNVTVRRMEVSYLKPDERRFGEVDGGLVNALTTFNEAKKAYRNAPPSTIMASGPPFHNFIAATLLARYFGAKLVLEYRDEWSECPFDFVRKHDANRQWESWSLSKADLVIFTTESHLQHQIKVFPQLDIKKCVVIPNGWDQEDLSISSKRETMTVESQKTLTLAYFGYLGAAGEPAEFLTTLNNVFQTTPYLSQQLRVQFVGTKSKNSLSQINQFKHQGVVELLDQVPKPEACKMMMSADALLLLNPPNLKRYIPGKLYDYLSSGTPVLVFGEGGEAAAIVKKLNAGIVIPSNNASALEQALTDIKMHRPNVGPEMDNWLQSRSRKVLALHTLNVLNQLETSA